MLRNCYRRKRGIHLSQVEDAVMAVVGGVDYPTSYAEFRSSFPVCLDYLD